jgi:transcriptional regulator with XRE-family HTH domain
MEAVATHKPDPVEQFALNLKALRKKACVSQEDLAKRSGVHASEISRLERGDRDPRLTTLVKLADGLGCSVGDLLDRVKITYTAD